MNFLQKAEYFKAVKKERMAENLEKKKRCVKSRGIKRQY